MNIVEDSTRAMLRLKSLFRARDPGAGHAHLREKGPGALAEKALGSRGPLPGRDPVCGDRSPP
jgi:hypothetical protein